MSRFLDFNDGEPIDCVLRRQRHSATPTADIDRPSNAPYLWNADGSLARPPAHRPRRSPRRPRRPRLPLQRRSIGSVRAAPAKSPPPATSPTSSSPPTASPSPPGKRPHQSPRLRLRRRPRHRHGQTDLHAQERRIPRTHFAQPRAGQRRWRRRVPPLPRRLHRRLPHPHVHRHRRPPRLLRRQLGTRCHPARASPIPPSTST